MYKRAGWRSLLHVRNWWLSNVILTSAECCVVAARRVGGEIIDVVMWLLCDGIAQNYPSSAAHCSRRLHTHVDERAAAAVSCRVWRDAACNALSGIKNVCTRPKRCIKTACKQPDSVPHHCCPTVCTPIVQRSQKSTLTQGCTLLANSNAPASCKNAKQESPRHKAGCTLLATHNAPASRTPEPESPRHKTGRPPAPRGSRNRLRALRNY